MQNSVKVSMRKLAIALFSAYLVIMPLSVHALGFGNIRINSALNEPLDAEIDLLSATSSDLKGLKIQMASPEAFMRAGIERPGHLTQINFAIRKRDNGRPYLKLTTRQSVREPFLDFLLEMNWKSGRMLREYTVLLDPPGQMRQQPTLVASPETGSTEAVAKQDDQPAESPFVTQQTDPEPVVEAEPVVEVEPEPSSEVTDAEPIEIESEPVVADSIAAAETDAEPVVEEEPVTEESIAEQEPVSDSLAAETEAEPVVADEAPAEETDVSATTDADAAVIDETPAEPIEIEQAAEPDTTASQEPVSIAAGEEIDPFADETQTRLPAEEEAAPVEEAQPGIEDTAVADTSAEFESQDTTTEPAEDLEIAGGADVDMQEGVTTQKSDRLWKIAESMLPDESITIYQMMLALQQSNPDAFVEGNVHRLKVGKVLRIEDPSILDAMSKRQAALEYQAQTESWEDYRQQLAGGDTPTQAEMAGEPGLGETGEAVDGATATQPDGELVLVAPEGENLSAGTSTDGEAVSSEVVVLREEIRQALREAEAEGNKNIELNARLRELEGQLNDLQRSLSVKDDELASLQQQLSTVNQQNIASEQLAETTENSQELEVDGKASGQETAKPDETAPTEAVTAETATAEKGSTETTPGETTAETETTATAETAVTDPTEVTDPTTAIVTDPAAGGLTEPQLAQKGFLDNFMAALPVSPLVLAIAVGGVVFLLVMLLFLMKRRREASTFQESILSGVPQTDDMTLPEEVSLQTNLSGESSFLSDFAISGASALSSESSEVDPLTEADVFMAYGRYEAAEESILKAIENDPQRNELRIKLLELYNTTRNRESFERAAEDFFTTIGHDAGNPQWQKVIAMGSVLAPDSPLFNESNMASATDDFSFGTDETVVRNEPADATVIRNQQPVDTTVIRPQDSGDQTVIRGNQNDEVVDIGLDTGAFENNELQYEAPVQDVTEPAAFRTDVTERVDQGVDSSVPELDLDFDDVDLDLSLDEVAKNNQMDAGADALDFNLDEAATEQVDNIDFEMPADEPQASSPADEQGLDFPSVDDAPDVLDLDFNLEDTDLAAATAELEQTAETIMEVSAAEQEANNQAVPELELDEMTMQAMDVDDIDVGGDMTMEMSQPPEAATEEALSMDNITASDMTMAELDATDAMELDIPMDIDEVGTKLDLAKAYIDMGDPDGARSILDEVMTEGTPPQQQEAQNLMQQI